MLTELVSWYLCVTCLVFRYVIPLPRLLECPHSIVTGVSRATNLRERKRVPIKKSSYHLWPSQEVISIISLAYFWFRKKSVQIQVRATKAFFPVKDYRHHMVWRRGYNANMKLSNHFWKRCMYKPISTEIGQAKLPSLFTQRGNIKALCQERNYHALSKTTSYYS